MKYHHHKINNNIEEIQNVKIPQPNNPLRKTIFLILFFVSLTTFPLYLRNNTPLVPQESQPPSCDIFEGAWVPSSDEPLYTNQTCGLIIDEQNCMKLGRPDTEFLKWRWKPDGCELPEFDAAKFLDLVRNKSIAFLGDSVGKNQMYSLLCLLSQAVGEPEDVSEKYSNNTTYFKRYIFGEYNLTVATLWAPFLVRAEESDPNGYSPNSKMSLFVDEPSPGWSTQAQRFDVLVVSAGQWFFRPAKLIRNRTPFGCSNCPESDPDSDRLVPVTTFETYRLAFRTLFEALTGFTGLAVLRTFSPSHFEGGAWNSGGRGERREPLAREAHAEWYVGEMRRVQVEEFEAAKQRNNKSGGLGFGIIDTTRAMFLRPDGHPNFYGRSPHRNMSYADCVHWCLPGPIDLWNQILLHLLSKQT